MRAMAAMVAHSAHTEDGLLHVEGAGWEWAKLPALPATVDLVFAGIFVVAPDEVDRKPTLRIAVEGPTGPVAHVDHTFGVDTKHQIPGSPIHEPRVITLEQVTFVEWGLHRLTVTALDDDSSEDLAAAEFLVVESTRV